MMKHIQTLNTRDLCESAKNGGCGECQTSCQSACKTSCGIANQQCENSKEKYIVFIWMIGILWWIRVRAACTRWMRSPMR